MQSDIFSIRQTFLDLFARILDDLLLMLMVLEYNYKLLVFCESKVEYTYLDLMKSKSRLNVLFLLYLEIYIASPISCFFCNFVGSVELLVH